MTQTTKELTAAERVKRLPLTARVASAGGMQGAMLETIVANVAQDALDPEIASFVYQICRTNLDPLARQIYLVGRWGKKEGRNLYSVQVGIDGYRLIADRTGAYAGSSDPIFDEGLTQYHWIQTGREEPVSATVTIRKLLSNGAIGEFTASALWMSYYPGDTQGYMWRRFPLLMLGKVAEALALRKAFPAQLSGLYIAEEMAQAGESEDNAAAIALGLGYKNPNAIRVVEKLDALAGFNEEWVKTALGVTVGNIEATEEGDSTLRRLWQYCTEAAKGSVPVTEEAFVKYMAKE